MHGVIYVALETNQCVDSQTILWDKLQAYRREPLNVAHDSTFGVDNFTAVALLRPFKL